MIRANKQFANVTSLKSIKSESNLRKQPRKNSLGASQNNIFDRKAQICKSQTNLLHENSDKTIYKSPPPVQKFKTIGTPDKSVRSGVIKQFNQLFCLHRSNDLNGDIEMIERFKKEMQRAFKELKKLEAESRESYRTIQKMKFTIQQLENQNKELKRLGAYKDNLIFTLEEKIRVLLDQNMLIQRNKSNNCLDIVVHTQNQIKNLSKMSPRLANPKPPLPRDLSSKDLTNSTVSLKEKQELRSLQQKLRTTEVSLGFYKQRQTQLQNQIQQLQQQLERHQVNNKNNFETHKDTIMMLYTQAASLEAFL